VVECKNISWFDC